MQVRDWYRRLSLWVGILLLVPLVGLSKAMVPSLGMDHKFYVKRIKIEGNSLVRTSTLEKAVSSYEGKRVDLGELEKAAEAVTKVYAEHGYGFARAYPPHNPYVSRFGATDLFTLVRAHGALRRAADDEGWIQERRVIDEP
jgi:hypothetical protein